MIKETNKQDYIDWLDTFDWSFWSTLTTDYELTMKSARRAAERYHEFIKKLANGYCKMFFVLEPFDIKDGMHIHALILLPDHFHDKLYYQQLIDAWQICSGKGRRVKDENDKWVAQTPNRIELKKYRSDIKASGYCTKYIMKQNSDYDILI